MARNLYVCISLLIVLIIVRCENLCNEEFCTAYLENQNCPDIPESCKVQNSTDNGIFLPSAGPCNCCEYCVENLDEGENCPLGNPSNPTPTGICGSGLSCKLTDKVGTCQKMITPCMLEQLAYDQNVEAGLVGHLETRPFCDHNGLYKHHRCVPGEICYCVSEDGKRIFGEVPFTPTPYFSLKCECSRNYEKAKQTNNRDLNPFEHFRCQPNGDYDTIQCIDDKCLCVDADNGHLTYPEMDMVNTTLISGTSLPCFDNETHLEAEYYRDCERKYLDIINRSEQYKMDGFEMISQIMPNCQLDGHYAPVQETLTTKYCSDIFGVRLETYELPKTESLSLSMNCNCARTTTILSTQERPECCKNGNYKSIQRRRGLCRCVDINGNQIGKEVDCNEIVQLNCFTRECTAK